MVLINCNVYAPLTCVSCWDLFSLLIPGLSAASAAHKTHYNEPSVPKHHNNIIL